VFNTNLLCKVQTLSSTFIHIFFQEFPHKCPLDVLFWDVEAVAMQVVHSIWAIWDPRLQMACK